MSLQRQLATGVAWSTMQNVGTQAVSLLVFMVLSRLLAPEAFGLVAIATAIIAFAQILVEQGLGEALVQRKEIEREHLDTAFWTNLASGGLFTLLIFGGADVLALLFDEPRVAGVVRWLSLSFVLGSLAGVHRAILLRDLRFRDLAIRTLVSVVAGGGVGVGLALAGFGAYSLVGQLLTRQLVDTLLLWRFTGWRPRAAYSRRHFRELLAFGANMIGLQITSVVNHRLDNLIIGAFLGATALGYYSVGYQVFTVITSLTMMTINPVVFPVLSRLQGSPERMRDGYHRVARVVAAAGFPAFAVVAALAPVLIPSLFGAKWAPSVPVLQALAALGLVQTALSPVNTALKAAGKPSQVLFTQVLSAGLNIVGILLAVRWGIVAVAVAVVVRAYLVAPISLHFFGRVFAVAPSVVVRDLSPAVVSSAVMMAGVSLTIPLLSSHMHAFATMGIALPLGLGLYAVSMLVVAPQTAREIRLALAVTLQRWTAA